MRYDELSPSVPGSILAKKSARETEKELQQATEDLGKASHKVRSKDPESDWLGNSQTEWFFFDQHGGLKGKSRKIHKKLRF